MPPKLGILAGRGELPGRLVDACRDAGREFFVVAFNGETDPATVADGVDHAWVDVPAVGQTIRLLKQAGASELVLIGPVGRPDFSALKPDWHGVRLLPKVIKAAQQGDDALMKVVVEDLEKQGFSIVAAEAVLEILAAPAGALGARSPDQRDMADIQRGMAVVVELGRLDIGQAAVVRDGYVLAVEAAEGTDEMLRRCREFRGDEAAGVLVKLPKPGQERRVDLPAIGPPTVAGAAAAGLKGIALEAGGALITDREAVARAADAAGLFVFGVAPADGA
ncbi:MAG: UDP-2,3-diacylglucosamine diphosphatase LpxI [Alphaproteobacteria bacterium]|nr:UDP-2,3-diacylglucosamine diphosphatase LpxI [Alphaproteobacteria bacterium]MDP6563868.1 UDP-2,3-diacylglucosamine diphosphatase LpxI [Alphaproteobacteria bacterium]MDP6814248.1 UDP-2,3-diacylglucosamine diphosphatase LpxI [Alphaproteobacteria bacterium]